MLHYKTIDARTLGILRKLMQIPELNAFKLAGGTALALQLGHRISFDLDFFGHQEIDKDEIVEYLESISGVKTIQQTRNILIFDMGGLKIDFMNYRYPTLNNGVFEDGLRLFSKPDIAAMKLAAIAGRGKKRDFFDIYFLLREYSLRELLDFYNRKYSDGSEMMVCRSLLYFNDADLDEDIQVLNEISWSEIKTAITNEVKKYCLF